VHSCPLCGTAMEMDQLLDGINRLGGVDAFRPEIEVMANAESHANTRISELSGALRTLERLVAASDPPATMEELLRNSRDLRSHVDQLRRIVDQAQSLLDSLAQTGFVAAEYEELLAQLPGGGAR